MGFGMSYELLIVLFVVVAGLLFIDLNMTDLYVPFLQLAMFIGIIFLATGWAKRDYDEFFTGIALIIGALAMLSAAPTYVTGNVDKTAVIQGVAWPITTLMQLAYAIGPIGLGILLLVIAYIISRAK